MTLPRELSFTVPWSDEDSSDTPARAQQWPYTVENNEGYSPPQCEYLAVQAAVVAACDGLDGLIDGVISAPALCTFDAQSLVNKTYICNTDGTTHTFSQKTADVVSKLWQGPTTPDGEFLWYGIIKGANFSGQANTTTNSSGTFPVPFGISDQWFKGFLAKDFSFDTSKITYADFASKPPFSLYAFSLPTEPNPLSTPQTHTPPNQTPTLTFPPPRILLSRPHPIRLHNRQLLHQPPPFLLPRRQNNHLARPSPPNDKPTRHDPILRETPLPLRKHQFLLPTILQPGRRPLRWRNGSRPCGSDRAVESLG